MLFYRLKIILIGLSNLFNFSSAPEEEIKVIDYKTEYVYSEKYAEGEELIITNGENGYIHLKEGEEIERKEPVAQIVQVGTHKDNNYNGTLTGYGPDCKGCNKKGYVACQTKEKSKWSLISNGIIYTDEDYGEVNIVASDHSLFPCGTIIEITNANYDHILAVVLDTGYTMRKEWRTNKKVHIDLALTTEKGSNLITNKNTDYYVKRWGW